MTKKNGAKPAATAEELRTALADLVGACDRVTADQRSVVRWNSDDMAKIAAARALAGTMHAEGEGEGEGEKPAGK